MADPILRMDGITKVFGGTRALVNGSLSLYPGQVTALIGENGAGKSTLVRTLTGVYPPDGGEIYLDGKPVRVASPSAAQKLGIGVIHQESVVFEDLTVAENIFVTERPLRFGMVDWDAMNRHAVDILAQLECTVAPTTLMRELSVAQKHLVQIARALAQDARVVVMDEPTAALSHHEVNDLLAIVRRLRAEGRAILLITHKFEEIFAVCDRYAVFRDGEAVGEGLIADVDTDRLVSLMVGREMSQVFPPRDHRIGAEVMRAEGLSRAREFADVGFTLRAGEVLGIYGLVGSGRSEVMQALFGLEKLDRGRVSIEGREIVIRSPSDAIGQRIAYVPEDRQRQGAHLTLPIRSNMTLPSLGRFARLGWLLRGREERNAQDFIERLQIRTRGPIQAVGDLSGGNQQKVVLAKWLGTDPRVLILDEPTKGIDVGAKTAVYGVINELVKAGLAVIMVSSELPEVLGMSDRIMVMRRGRVSALFERAEATPEKVVAAATDAAGGAQIQ